VAPIRRRRRSRHWRAWAAFGIVLGVILLGAALLFGWAAGACDNQCPDPTLPLLGLVIPGGGLLFFGLWQLDGIRREDRDRR
jgi:hypothetical protein